MCFFSDFVNKEWMFGERIISVCIQGIFPETFHLALLLILTSKYNIVNVFTE